ncbi:MAG: hypothetical protein HQ515_16135 [Phycisphaeraceae bacterium]|nr:hypothetical protein [Phycisphaeraceae bacterium]
MMTQRQASTQTKSFSGKKTGLLIAMILILMCTGQAWAQSSLGDLVREGGNEWLIGTWKATTDDGDSVTLSYKWELNKNMITTTVDTPEFESKSIIILSGADSEVKQVGADTMGRTLEGLWTGEYGVAVLRQTTTDQYGDKEVTEFTVSQKDSKTMTVSIRNISNTGWSDSYPEMTIELKRQAKP